MGHGTCIALRLFAFLALAHASGTTICIRCESGLLTKSTIALRCLCWTDVALARTHITSFVVLPRDQCLGKWTFCTSRFAARLTLAYACLATVFVLDDGQFLPGHTFRCIEFCRTDRPLTGAIFATAVIELHDNLLGDWALIAFKIFTFLTRTSTSVATVLVF